MSDIIYSKLFSHILNGIRHSPLYYSLCIHRDFFFDDYLNKVRFLSLYSILNIYRFFSHITNKILQNLILFTSSGQLMIYLVFGP